MRRLSDRLNDLLFGHRRLVLLGFLLASMMLGGLATQLGIDTSFGKHLPRSHPYMQVFNTYQAEFGGGNRLLVAVGARSGNIFTADYMKTLKEVTDAVFFLPGINKASVRSLFTPNVRFIEIVERGLAGGNVVPADFQGSADDLTRVRANVVKAGIVGRLVANDFSAAMVSADLVEIDAKTGEKLDYIAVARLLEENIRQPFTTDTTSIHIIGFAKAIGDITDGATGVILFFALAFLLTGLLVYGFVQSARYTVLLLACSVLAVIWTLGLLTLFGFAMDPMSILVPFLVFAIGVSHGLQVVTTAGAHIADGALGAARAAFRQLVIPGAAALASDCVGFLAILLIDVQIIQDLALTMSLGVAAILFTNLILLPVALSYISPGAGYPLRRARVAKLQTPLWRRLTRLTTWPASGVTLCLALLIAGGGLYLAQGHVIGDVRDGVPELRPDSRYNKDSAYFTERFSLGVDVLSVMVETRENACVDFAVMDRIDDFAMRMSQISGVQSTISLAQVARLLNASFNEGHPKWQSLPRNTTSLVQSVSPVETSTGLLDADCSVMPVLIFTVDHRSETIDRVTAAVQAYASQHETADLRFRLASGNLGVMAATNDLVRDNQVGILLFVYGAVIALCLITFRSLPGTACVVLPLALVSMLAYALMALLDIGLKISTLPVAALGAGIGVDYGLYVFSRIKQALDRGDTLPEAYRQAMTLAGNAVLVTGLTLALGVSTWIFSDLQFQADMGILLTFMFLANLVGAIVLLPALAWLLLRRRAVRA